MGSPNNRICDFCGGASKAVVYCRADSAKLCFSCDREVHSTNPLFTKHTRSFLCDVCDSSPASILCSTESRVLCQNCDWTKHNRSISNPTHDRRPLEGFSGCPNSTDLLAIAGLDDDLGDKNLSSNGNGDGDGDGDDVFSDFLIWDTPSIVTYDDLIVPTDSDHNFRAMGVPSLPKNRKAACGQHKDEILHQLRQLWNSETGLNSTTGDAELKPLTVSRVQSMPPTQNHQPGNVYIGGHQKDANTIVDHDFEEAAFQWYEDVGDAVNEEIQLLTSYTEEGFGDGRKPSVVGGSASHVNNDGNQGQSDISISTANGVFPVLPKSSPHEVTPQDRETAISRYKEKKKTRRYEKHIRYESRKVRAESRIRIKGRFAKIDH